MKITDINGKEYTIEKAVGASYEGLRALWHDVFGDPPEYVDAFYANFGEDITGYVVTDESDRVCSALTCHLCGFYEDRPVYVSYAICTRGDMRGKGLAAMLTSFVRDKVIASGGISVVSPAEPSLVSYYAELGYEPYFLAVERAVMSPEFDEEDFLYDDEFDLDIEGAEDSEPLMPEIDLQPLTEEKYNRFREAFLSGRPHIEPDEAMLRLMRAESMDGCGMCSVNRGDAICVISSADPARVVITELILNPVLHELSMDIDSEIAAMIAKHFGAAETVFATPGAGGCQGMAAGIPEREEPYEDPDEEGSHSEEEFSVQTAEPFYGFPIQ